MPPKHKFSPDQIVAAGFEVVRSQGWRALSTRAVAARLGSSARPIYSFFKSISELEEQIVALSVDLLHDLMTRPRTGDPWHDHGIGYVMFAWEESHLFRSINDENHIHHFKQYGDVIWMKLTASLAEYPRFKGLAPDQVYKIQAYRWLFAHGVAYQVSNRPPGIWDADKITTVITEGSDAIYDGLAAGMAKQNNHPPTNQEEA